MSPDAFLARALLSSGMLSRSQLDIALKWLEESPAGGLGDLLCTNGVIPRPVYDALMRFYKKDTSRVGVASTGNRDRGVREAQLFCLIGLREEDVSAEQMKDAIDMWVRLEAMGKLRPIGEVMIEKGYLDLGRQRELTARTKESTLACQRCGEQDFLYKVTGSPFTCDKCKGPLGPARAAEGVATPVDPMAGTLIAGARIDEKIGQGRWSTVYKGLAPAQNRPVAVKLFSAEAPPSTVNRWVEAAQKAIPILSPTLVGVIDAGAVGDRGYIVMELVTDGRRWPEREKMGWRLLCKVGIDLARALASVHAHGMAHGDVRPASVFVRESGAKLGDCGLAHDGTLAVPCDALITAPEIWKNEPLDPVKTDLYALGVTLYSFAAGRPPFEASDPRALDIAHRGETPKSPGAWNLELPRALSAVIMKLLEKDPIGRYGFAEEVARDFEAILRGETPHAAGGQESRTCRFCRTANPATEQTCLVCGKPMVELSDMLLLDDEAPCPKCTKPLSREAKACSCGYSACVMCKEREADAEFGYCSTCLTPELADKLRRKRDFRAKPTLGKPGGGGLKPAPPGTRSLKPPPPAAGLKPAPPAAGLKPAPPPAGGLKAPPPPAGGEDDLDFDALPPPAAKAAAPAAGDADDLDFDALPPPKPPEGDDLLPPEPPPKKGPPSRPKTGLMDRRRRG